MDHSETWDARIDGEVLLELPYDPTSESGSAPGEPLFPLLEQLVAGGYDLEPAPDEAAAAAFDEDLRTLTRLRIVPPDDPILSADGVRAHTLHVAVEACPGGPLDPEWPKTQFGATGIAAAAAWDKGWRGKGVRVAIVDSGIFEHPDLAGGLVAGANVTTSFALAACDWRWLEPFREASTIDRNGHGTRMAGVVGARGTFPPTRAARGQYGIGVAPECEVVPIKCARSAQVVNPKGVKTATGKLPSGTVAAMASTKDMARGIELAVLKYDAHVVNVSMVSPVDKALEAAATLARTWRRLLVAATGNSGLEEQLHPAGAKDALAVSAVQYSSMDLRLEWAALSTWGAHVDVAGIANQGATSIERRMGPFQGQPVDCAGKQVTGATVTALDPVKATMNAATGTSAACASVSGAAAVVLSAMKPTTDPLRAGRLLRNAAKLVHVGHGGSTGVAPRIGSGLVQVTKAASAAGPPTRPPLMPGGGPWIPAGTHVSPRVRILGALPGERLWIGGPPLRLA